MIGPLVGIGGIACILVFAELLRVAKLIRHGEMLRKFVHILTGVFASSWAFFIPFRSIQYMSILLLVTVLISLRWYIFKSVHGVSRQTYGEILFPIGIFVSAALTSSEWVYMAAVLHLGLADGLAAAVGMWRARRFRYRIWGQYKSLLGSATFFIVSFSITAGVLLLDPTHMQSMSILVLAWLPIAATLIESVAVYGTDNVFVPLLVVVTLNVLQ